MAHRTSRMALAFLIGGILAAAWLLRPHTRALAQASPSVHYVAPGGNCGGMTPCYASVQDAVNAAAPGDEIRVAAGTYTGVQNYPPLNIPDYFFRFRYAYKSGPRKHFTMGDLVQTVGAKASRGIPCAL